MATHLLLDFFGTLVDYSPSRTEQGYPRSHALLTGWGAQVDYVEFLAAWSAVSAEFDRRSEVDDREFSMTELGTEFLRRVLGAEPDPAGVETFVATYLSEWNAGVRCPAGMPELLADLASRHRLVVVTNTHRAELVPDHLAAIGVAHLVDAVVTSVEVGWRKPHPAIYAAALDAAGVPASAAVFVGDTFAADFAGPEAVGIRSFLIDPANRHPVPAGRRLASLFDLPDRLAGRAG
ncbi:HAD family hydrolase [Micromonospora sp. C28SCA-DRY-2]|uniref:HAD family hydrolase n=1 Tax=Micromonospora sp. C28SCA-DRY-2 TaxID=3059522 RepID=UPI002674D4AA|nr:HAD family hydrolase [Micromonospora sp. C28SCA-DRY-2]MDO3700435.1 HAD family hydrolase [Micromonospora sp. C28SCA-DRY-2]